MPIFVADHQNKIAARSSFLRPVHTGAALVPPNERGPEPDLGVPNSISAQEAYADLRLHHYVRHVMQGSDDPIAIFQYRRVFYVESEPFPENNLSLNLVRRRFMAGKSRIPIEHRAPYFNYLVDMDDGALTSMLSGVDFLAYEYRPRHGIKRNFLRPNTGDFLGCDSQEMLEDFWNDLEVFLTRMLGKEPVAEGLDKFGYFHNMMITTGHAFSAYCDFLFELFENLSAYLSCKRLFGYAGERVLAPYLIKRRARLSLRNIATFK